MSIPEPPLPPVVVPGTADGVFDPDAAPPPPPLFDIPEDPPKFVPGG